MSKTPTTTTEFAGFLQNRAGRSLPGPEAQRRFAPVPQRPDWEPHLRPDTARHAAAVLLLYDSPQGLVIPLTVRHAGLAQHAGQVSLPGGALDPGESPEAAALREAEEEIGIAASEIQILGALSTVWIGVSQFLLHPFIGVITGSPAFQLHPQEVEAVLHAPVRDLCSGSHWRWAHRERDRVRIHVPYFEVGGHRVWGATAMILGEFACLFEPGLAPTPREVLPR